MMVTLDDLLDGEEMGEFEPCIWYEPLLQRTICLTEDVSYVSEMVDDQIDVLWHPSFSHVVGVQIWGRPCS